MTGVSDPLVGQVLDGRYEVLARLARGGMATVYRGLDRRLTRVVAIKVMHEGLGGDTDFAKKFDREARAAATLSNPHVVSVFDQGQDHGRPYIVMEFVDGSTLRHLLNREGPMEPLRALELIEAVAHALASAHDSQMVHRDVKPENVLISSRGQVKVADFGLARAVTAQTATATQGLLMGTVSYMPPELVTRARADASGDVYSTGVMLFEMLTGQKPHVAETPIAVAWSHVHHDIPAPSTLLGRATDTSRIIPPYLDALVVACTRRQSSDRPRDARELLALVRTARRSLRKGVMDDPALTDLMLASTRHDPGRDERTVPDPDGRPEPPHRSSLRQGAQSAGAPPRPVSHRPTSPHSEPIHRLEPAVASVRLTAPTPKSPTDHSAPGHGPDYRVDLSDKAVDGSSLDPRRRTSAGSSSVGWVGRDDQDDSEGFAVPRPVSRARTNPPTTRSPRSPRTPVFSHISHEPVHRRRRGLVAALLVLVLVVGLIVTSYLYVTRWSYTTAPPLANLSEGQATSLAHSEGFSIVSESQFSETVQKGSVISSDPTGGERVKKGTSLHVFISSGPERYATPTLVGFSLDEARQALSRGRLTLGTLSQAWNETVPVGVVVKSSQPEGTLLKKNTPIDLTVSKGPQPIPIASYVGKSADDASTALGKAGFTVTRTEQNSDTVAKGVVISQSPDRGNGKKGDTVRLVVSKGPVLVSVPRVTGKDEAQAREKLTQAGFKVTVTYNTPDWLRLNVVAGQDPASGRMIPKGSTVTIFVS